jgi:hypothetical protein
MSISNSLAFTICALLLLTTFATTGFSQCKKIDATAKVVDETGDVNTAQGKSIVVDIKSSSKDKFEVSLFGPNRKNELHTDKTEFQNLSSGKYLIVIVGKKEEDNYCPQPINITIN